MPFLLIALLIWALIFLSWKFERGFIRFQVAIGFWMKLFVDDLDAYFKRKLILTRVVFGLIGLILMGKGLEQILR